VNHGICADQVESGAAGLERDQEYIGAAGLEWTTTSPPPTSNFEKTPIVEDEAYAYEKIEVPYD